MEHLLNQRPKPSPEDERRIVSADCRRIARNEIKLALWHLDLAQRLLPDKITETQMGVLADTLAGNVTTMAGQKTTIDFLQKEVAVAQGQMQGLQATLAAAKPVLDLGLDEKDVAAVKALKQG